MIVESDFISNYITEVFNGLYFGQKLLFIDVSVVEIRKQVDGSAEKFWLCYELRAFMSLKKKIFRNLSVITISC